MHTFFNKECYITPLDESNNPYTLANRTNGLIVYEFMAKEAYIRNRFNTAIQSKLLNYAKLVLAEC
jgi:hypothetical protein